MSGDRFRVYDPEEAVEAGYAGAAEHIDPDGWGYCRVLIDTKTGEVVGDDYNEPEDSTFYRGWSWVVDLLNDLAEGKR